MHTAFLFPLLAALQSSLVSCKPVDWDPSTASRASHRSSLKTSSGTEHLLLNMNLNGQLRKAIRPDSLVILPMRKGSTELVSIFDLRKKRYLCMDAQGVLFSSMMVSREECLFRSMQIGLENHLDAFDSSRTGPLLSLQVSEKTRGTSAEDQKSSSVLLQKLLLPQVYRTKRSQQVSDPSDPLRTENNRQPKLTEEQELELHQGQSDKEQSGAVSKETIASCDDPLQVLKPNGPVSPIKINLM